jgi:hypothetical protein
MTSEKIGVASLLVQASNHYIGILSILMSYSVPLLTLVKVKVKAESYIGSPMVAVSWRWKSPKIWTTLT